MNFYRKILSKTMHFFVMVVLVANMIYVGGSFLSPEIAEAADIWPDCSWDNCTANDSSVPGVWLGDCTTGDPIDTCIPGEHINTCIWAEFTNDTGAKRYAVTLSADIYVDEVNTESITNCEIDLVEGKTTEQAVFHNLNWECGSEIRLDNPIIGWSTNKDATCSAPSCDYYTKSQCEKQGAIFVAAPLIADFDFNSVCDGQEVSFYGDANGGVGPYSYSWDFDDGDTSTLENPKHTYDGPGTYHVTLTVTDDDLNSDSQTYDVEVYGNPQADFSADPLTGKAPVLVSFTDTSTRGSGMINSWSWNFGDSYSLANLSSEQNPTHIYTYNTAYSVSLTVVDEHGCSDTEIKENYINTAECEVDSDCDDGLYCSGTETCSNGTCVSGTKVDCSGNNIPGVDTCGYEIEGNPFTIDFRTIFTSQCNEEIDSCTIGDDTVNSSCSVGECGAECDTNTLCANTICSDLSGCVGVDYYEYSDIANSCNSDCTCETNSCAAPVVNYGACGGCTGDMDCNALDKNYCTGSFIMHDEGICENYVCTVRSTRVKDCDNGLACDGEESCDAAKCVVGTPVDCSLFNISAVGECGYEIDGNPYTWDYRKEFTSQCIEPTKECTRGDNTVESSCDSVCGGCTGDIDCDDSNSSTVDVCDLSNCTCSNTYSTLCGNGVLDVGEQCDDRNNYNQDGCSSLCQWETQTFYCSEKPVNTEWNIVDSYLQTCAESDGVSCISWLPVSDVVTEYSATSSADSCQFICSAGYDWNGAYCQEIASNPFCGDTYCNGTEDCLSCPLDCGKCDPGQPVDPYCGDGSCNGGETCSTCSSDCGACSSGGGGLFISGLQINNPQLFMQCVDGDLSLTVSWLTNKPATSRVVYGDNSVPDASLDLGSNYGYVSSTVTDSEKVTGHSVSVDGVEQGSPFYFRTLSSASSEILSMEKGVAETLVCEGDNTDTDVIVLGEEGEPALEIEKKIDAEYANPGDKNIKYTIILRNVGNLDAFDVVLNDTLPEGLIYSDEGDNEKNWEVGDLASGEEKIFEYFVDVEDDAELRVYTSTATASALNNPEVSASVDLEVRKIPVLSETGFDVREMFYLIGLMSSFFILSRVVRRNLV